MTSTISGEANEDAGPASHATFDVRYRFGQNPPQLTVPTVIAALSVGGVAALEGGFKSSIQILLQSIDWRPFFLSSYSNVFGDDAADDDDSIFFMHANNANCDNWDDGLVHADGLDSLIAVASSALCYLMLVIGLHSAIRSFSPGIPVDADWKTRAERAARRIPYCLKCYMMYGGSKHGYTPKDLATGTFPQPRKTIHNAMIVACREDAVFEDWYNDVLPKRVRKNPHEWRDEFERLDHECHDADRLYHEMCAWR